LKFQKKNEIILEGTTIVNEIYLRTHLLYREQTKKKQGRSESSINLFVR